MLRLYNTALLALRPAVAVWAMLHSLRADRREEWSQRRARSLPRISPGGAWIHGASLGEARIVRALAHELRSMKPRLPLALSAFTPTGREALRGDAAADAEFFLPLDFSGYGRRALVAVRPSVLVLVETELWPNLLHEAHALEVPVLVLNGRLSGKRMARYRSYDRLYRPLVRSLQRVGAQSARDAERFIELGLPPSALEITGNIKYDLPDVGGSPEKLRRRLGLSPERPVFVAGSTARGEDEQVLEAFRAARETHSGLFLILAPRHLERMESVERLIGQQGFQLTRLSASPRAGDADVLLVDTLGELAELYRLASVAFVGGSLVPVGGHNLLEPAVAGVPVLFGPHTEHFAEPAAALIDCAGGRRVRDATDLGRILVRLLSDPASRGTMTRNAAALLQSNRGAMSRSLRMILDVLERPATQSGMGAA